MHIIKKVKIGKKGNQQEKDTDLGWRDGSVVKSADCSCRGPRFDS